jgi:hypothetical protein
VCKKRIITEKFFQNLTLKKKKKKKKRLHPQVELRGSFEALTWPQAPPLPVLPQMDGKLYH